MLVAEGERRAAEKDLGRGVSAAYYALFHQCLTAAADAEKRRRFLILLHFPPR